jgi:hypothetical protein
MANKKTRSEVKQTLADGEIPNGQNFSDFVDSVIWHDDSIAAPPQKATPGAVTIAQDNQLFMTPQRTLQMIIEKSRLVGLPLLEQDIRSILSEGGNVGSFTITDVTIVQVGNLLNATVVVSNPNNLILEYSLDNATYQTSNIFIGLSATNSFFVRSGTQVKSLQKIQNIQVGNGQVACAAEMIIVAITHTTGEDYNVEFYGVDIQQINYQIQTLQGTVVKTGNSGPLTSANFTVNLSGLVAGDYKFFGTPTNCSSPDVSKRTKVFTIVSSVPIVVLPSNDISFVEPPEGIVIYNNDQTINDVKMKLVISGNNQNQITDEKWTGRETQQLQVSTTRRRVSDNFTENTVITITLQRAYMIDAGHEGANTFERWRINQPLVNLPLLNGMDYIVRIAYIRPGGSYERIESDGWAYQEPSYWTIGVKNPCEQNVHIKEI